MTEYFVKSAVLTEPPLYRYWLVREWGSTPRRTIGFLGYNPSTADASIDDQTIRKEVGFAQRWGFNRLVKANLYAYRSTDWRVLRDVQDPVGPDNHVWLNRLFAESEIVVCAWGGMPVESYARTLAVWAMGRPTARHLGKTKHGAPRHPLMLGYATELESF